MNNTHRTWVILLVAFAVSAGCAAPRRALIAASSSTFHYRLRLKHRQGEGHTTAYTISQDQAYAITLAILRQHNALALENTSADGSLVATLEDPWPLLSPEPATTAIGIWITPLNPDRTKVTVLRQAYHALALGRKVLSEEDFHREFAAALSQQPHTDPPAPSK